MSFIFFHLSSKKMTAQAGIKAALRAAHAALSSNAFDEAIAAAREALELSENSSVDAYL